MASLARKLLDVYDRGALERLVEDSAQLERAKRVGREWLGSDIWRCSASASGLPFTTLAFPKPICARSKTYFRAAIADSHRIANLSSRAESVCIDAVNVQHPPRHQGISGEDFGNVIGRAGRAHVDIDGQILYVLFEPTRWRLQEWEKLKGASQGKEYPKRIVCPNRAGVTAPEGRSWLRQD